VGLIESDPIKLSEKQMEIGTYEIALIGVGATIVGSLVGTWMGYRLSISLAVITAKKHSELKLRDAFRNEILMLNPARHALEEDLPTFLQKAFDKHETAIFDFSFYLKPKQQRGFI
jgi:hypothetical protein